MTRVQSDAVTGGGSVGRGSHGATGQRSQDTGLPAEMGQLFLAMAEELKLPLLQIARAAELEAMLAAGQIAKTAVDGRSADAKVKVAASQPAWRDICDTADMSLRLLDSYLMSLRLSLQPETKLTLEPVSVAAVLHDTARQLESVAGQYGVELTLRVPGRYEPVLAHRQALQSAMVSLGYALIEALPASGADSLRLQLAAHRTKYGIVAGVYGQLDGLSPRLFRRALDLQGYVRQPLVTALPGSGSGIFIANAIVTAMASRLRVGRYGRLPGFAMTLPASEQLQLV